MPERSRCRRRRNNAEERAEAPAKQRLRKVEAPRSVGSGEERSRCRSEAVPERSGAGAKQVPERAVNSKRPRSGNRFLPQPGRRHARDRAGQAATSVRLRAETAPAKVRSRCRNEAVPGARKTDGRESGRADRSSPLSPPFGRAGGRYRCHRIYRRADGASFRS